MYFTSISIKRKICKVKHIQEIMFTHLKWVMMLNCTKRINNTKYNMFIHNGSNICITQNYNINK